MDVLGFLSKALSASARVGLVITLAAGTVYALVALKIEPFDKIDPPLLTAILIAGVIGLATVLVDVAIRFCRWIAALLNRAWRWRQRRAEAIRAMDAPTVETLAILAYVKARNMRRFPAPTLNQRLNELVSHSLLIRDGSSGFMPENSYYRVPRYVWVRIDKMLNGQNFPPPVDGSKPWENRRI